MAKGNDMQIVQKTIEELRRYIAASEDRANLQEVDTLLDVALTEVTREIRRKETRRESAGRA